MNVHAEHLGYPSFTSYLESDHWASLVDKHLKSHCFCCGMEKYTKLQHVSYGMLGKERACDLMSVCLECRSKMQSIVSSDRCKPSLAHLEVKKLAEKAAKTEQKKQKRKEKREEWLETRKQNRKRPKLKKKTNSEYTKYLRSEHWQEMVDLYRRGKCFCCGRTKRLCLHHITYDRLGKEWATDFVTVCKSCHGRIHKMCTAPGPQSIASAHFALVKKMTRARKKRKRKKNRRN